MKMSETITTLEGWYAYHDFRTIDWAALRNLASADKHSILQELQAFVADCRRTEEARTGSLALYQIAGQKADLLFIHMRPTIAELNEVKYAFHKLRIADFLKPAYSYISVVELSNYAARPGFDPLQDAEVANRLYPILPKTEHVCFYPMNKRRSGNDNWYMLSYDERKTLMRNHGMIGRTYAGRVKQIITGSVGFDDWEWGVTLFAEDSLQFKKLVYEMRFDEVSARYGDFGAFYVGHILKEDDFSVLLG
jgi:peroxiredoxin